MSSQFEFVYSKQSQTQLNSSKQYFKFEGMMLGSPVILYNSVCFYLRHVLRAVFCHHHAEHQPAQPKRERQAPCGALHLHEQRHQRGGRPARGAAQGQSECVCVCVSVCVEEDDEGVFECASLFPHEAFVLSIFSLFFPRICLKASRTNPLRSQRMMGMTWHTPSSTQTERVGYWNWVRTWNPPQHGAQDNPHEDVCPSLCTYGHLNLQNNPITDWENNSKQSHSLSHYCPFVSPHV